MSQNFSRMSDIYIPELIELDSYWQRAVEDAIHDTLKGEKRLHYALRNRKKINEKLQKLGMKPVHSQMSFSSRCQFSSESLVDNQNTSKHNASSNTDSCEENSVISKGSIQVGEALSQGIPDPQKASLTPKRSKTKSNKFRETTPEKKYKNPERPILGDGSLEKMKKSQNSFCCEPMGMEDTLMKFKGKTIPKFMPKTNKIMRLRNNFNNLILMNEEDEKNKKVEWLHVGRNKAFDDSDTEASNISQFSPDNIKKKCFQNLNLQPNNIFKESKPETGQNVHPKSSVHRKIPMALDPTEDIFWENEVKNAIRENVGLERKLYFALAKREIINKNLKGLKEEEGEKEIQISEKEARLAVKRRNNSKYLSPFIKFYLQVYRELCQKQPVKQIGREAAIRWWKKYNKQQKKSHVKKSYK